MGVPGLWPILNPAAETGGLLQLADSSFRSSPSRGFRVGVDASLWMFHSKKVADIPDAGENADLRTLFYRVLSLMARGILPLFVFDGPHRPSWKRGVHVGGGGGVRKLEREFRTMIELLGGHWRKAEGEAEADLAAFVLSGEIDAVITDDVDTLLFRSPMIIRNDSPTLMGNKASHSAAPPAKFDVTIYRASTILSTLHLTPNDLILIALLSGGDYHPAGVKGCGPQSAVALARAGFATSLLAGLTTFADSPRDLQAFLDVWREQVAVELQTNASGFLTRKEVSLAGKIRAATDFPDPKIVRDYTHPAITTCRMDQLHWESDVDVPSLVAFTSAKFEWSCEEIIAKMRNNLWKGLAIRDLRRTALALDRNLPRTISISGPSMFFAVHESKTAPSTENVQSFRLELDPSYFLPSIIPHLPSPDPFAIPDEDPDAPPPDPSQPKPRKKPKEPEGRSSLSHWIPASFVEVDSSAMELVAGWKSKVEEKARKKAEMDDRRRRKVAGELTPPRKKAPPADAKGKRRLVDVTKVDKALLGGSIKSYLDSDDEDDDGVFAAAPLASSSALTARSTTPPRPSKGSRPRALFPPTSSDSDSALTKTPRKSREHQSPTKPRVTARRPPATVLELSDDEQPMLVRRPPKIKAKPKVVFEEKKASDVVREAMLARKKKVVEVIELSDSD